MLYYRAAGANNLTGERDGRERLCSSLLHAPASSFQMNGSKFFRSYHKI